VAHHSMAGLLSLSRSWRLRLSQRRKRNSRSIRLASSTLPQIVSRRRCIGILQFRTNFLLLSSKPNPPKRIRIIRALFIMRWPRLTWDSISALTYPPSTYLIDATEHTYWLIKLCNSFILTRQGILYAYLSIRFWYLTEYRGKLFKNLKYTKWIITRDKGIFSIYISNQ